MSESGKKFLKDLEVVRGEARKFPIRRADAKLYGTLAAFLHMANRAEQEQLVDELAQTFIDRMKQRRSNKNRTYFNSNPDAALVVGRLLFEDAGMDRNTLWRYTAAIREAQGRRIKPGKLVEWLTNNGGVNALFKSRRVESRSRSTRTLHLRDSVEMPKDEPITLTLQDDGSGFYRVLKVFSEKS